MTSICHYLSTTFLSGLYPGSLSTSCPFCFLSLVTTRVQFTLLKCTHVWAIWWDMSNLLMATLQKRMTFSPPATVSCWELLPPALLEYSLTWSCSVNHNWCELVCAMCMVSPEVSLSQTSLSTSLHSPFRFPESWVRVGWGWYRWPIHSWALGVT